MVSVTSITGNYILQPGTIQKHQTSLEWLSALLFWKSELSFFQKLLDLHASKFTSLDDKKKIDHFQNLIIYYRGELVDELRKKLREHESRLARTLKSKDELNTQYFSEHDTLMDELNSFSIAFAELKKDFFEFIEKVRGGI